MNKHIISAWSTGLLAVRSSYNCLVYIKLIYILHGRTYLLNLNKIKVIILHNCFRTVESTQFGKNLGFI